MAKRKKTANKGEDWGIPDSGPSEGENSSNSDPDEETVVSEPEDSGTEADFFFLFHNFYI